MKPFLLAFVCAFLPHLSFPLMAAIDSLPVRGLAIEAPRPADVVRFIDFVEHELAPRGVNLLVLRVDTHFDYRSHPELSSTDALSLEQVKQLSGSDRNTCIPQPLKKINQHKLACLTTMHKRQSL